MRKKRSASSAPGRRAARSVKPISDKGLDFSDIPDSSDGELKRARRVGRPTTGKAKQLIAIRLPPQLIASIKRMAQKKDKPYQTLINELLEKAVRKAA